MNSKLLILAIYIFWTVNSIDKATEMEVVFIISGSDEFGGNPKRIYKTNILETVKHLML